MRKPSRFSIDPAKYAPKRDRNNRPLEIGDDFIPHRKFIGAFIPNSIMRLPISVMSFTEKIVWARLVQYAGEDGKCYPKQEVLAGEVGASVSVVQVALRRLEENGFIRREHPTGKDRLLHRNNSYHFKWHECFTENPSEALNPMGLMQALNPMGANKEVNNKEVNNISKDISTGVSQNETPQNDLSEINKQPIQNETTPSQYNNTTPRTRKRATLVPPPAPATKSVKTDPFVEYWNGLKGAAPHKNPSTQVYKDCAAAIRKLANGTLFQNKTVDPKWMKDRHIPPKYLSRQLSPAQVRGVLDSLALLYVEGYWPEDKSWVKSLGLLGLLYNKMKGTSQALRVMVLPPDILKKIQEDRQEEAEDEITKADIETVLTAISETVLDVPSRRDVRKVVDTVWNWWDTWDEEARDRIPHGTHILNWFGDWLKIKARNWPTMPIRVIKKDSDVMQEFVAWVERDCLGGVNVETNGLR
jgi:hypothetical protein